MSYKVLYDFNSTNANPSSGLITDAAGNAYGTTSGGGHDGSGTVYELSPTTGYHLLYAFSKSGPGGRQPQGNLVFDSAGNLYGTTVTGGVKNAACGTGCGVVFELSPPSNGGLWTETVLYSFCSAAICADGANPQSGVIFDTAGNLYGTTKGGANQACQEEGPGCGTVFELQHSQSGWAESVLYAFMGTGVDGGYPIGSLVFDGAGNLYGTSPARCVFQLSPSTGGWVFAAIYEFGGDGDGTDAMAGLVFDASGNLYGTTAEGGRSVLVRSSSSLLPSREAGPRRFSTISQGGMTVPSQNPAWFSIRRAVSTAQRSTAAGLQIFAETAAVQCSS